MKLITCVLNSGGSIDMGKYKQYYISKERREALGFKRIMHSSEVIKIMESIGILVTSPRCIGNFATENGYESFDRQISKRSELFYKIKGTPTPNLKSIGIKNTPTT